jgi:hypothetical protein
MVFIAVRFWDQFRRGVAAGRGGRRVAMSLDLRS